MQIPWKLKSRAFAIADVVGHRYLYLAQKYLTRRSIRSVERIGGAWEFHRQNIDTGPGKRVIEFGAGKDLAQNLYLHQFGYQQTVVDLFPMIDLALVNRAIDGLSKLGCPMKGSVGSTADLLQRYQIDYRAPFDMRETGFPAGSLDCCISTATLEHIPTNDIQSIWAETFRVLSPGGIVSATIDYRDHYASTDRTITTLNFLKFSDDEWRAHNHAGHFQNRLRHRHHLDLLRAAGFEIISEQATRPVDPEGVNPRPELLTGDKTDFFTGGRIVARKPIDA